MQILQDLSQKLEQNYEMAFRQAFPQFRFRLIATVVLRLSVLLVSINSAPAVFGQTSYYTASHPLRLQGFGTLSYVQPKYADTLAGPGTNFGMSAGADLDFATHTWVIPGLEIRAVRSSGSSTTQFAYGGGPRVIFPLRHVEPYADFLLSYGKISFKQSDDPFYLSDMSTVYTYGGGVDVPVTPGWGFKVDVQRERWRLTHFQPPFFPLAVSIGVRYEVHGGKHSPQ